MIWVFTLDLCCFDRRQVLNPLQSLDMKLAPDPFIVGINQAESVTPIAVHVTVGFGYASVREKNSHLSILR
jgi:hypothetical protein